MNYLILSVLLYCNSAISQENNFPQSWKGSWEGELSIFSGVVSRDRSAQVLPVRLTIEPIDTNRWSWILMYEAPGQEPRNYELVRTSENDWVIDEKNGIVLKQTLMGNRLVSSFSVMGNLLICHYWLEKDALNMEIHMIKQDAESVTGLDTEESPLVSNHLIGTFQKAVLYRK